MSRRLPLDSRNGHHHQNFERIIICILSFHILIHILKPRFDYLAVCLHLGLRLIVAIPLSWLSCQKAFLHYSSHPAKRSDVPLPDLFRAWTNLNWPPAHWNIHKLTNPHDHEEFMFLCLPRKIGRL